MAAASFMILAARCVQAILGTKSRSGLRDNRHSWNLRSIARSAGEAPCPRAAEDYCAPLRMGVREILRLEFEEKTRILRGKKKVGLNPNCMNGVVGDQVCRKTVANGTSIGRHLPLIVSNYTQLQKLCHRLVEWQELSNAPLYGEGLPGRFIGSGFLAVDFPVGSEICHSLLVVEPGVNRPVGAVKA